MRIRLFFLSKFFPNFLLLVMIFPYFRFEKISTESDIQIYPILLATICIISTLVYYYFSNKRIMIPFFFTLLLTLCLYIFCISYILDSINLRNLFSYFSITTFFVLGYYFLKNNLLNIKTIYFSIFIYFIFGFYQKFFQKNFGEQLIGTFRGINTNRGAYSLTPEPSFYSNQLILIFIILLIYYSLFKEKIMFKVIMLSLIIIQISLFSMAITGIVYFVIFISIYLILSKRIFYFVGVLFSGLLASVLTSYMDTSSRLHNFFSDLFENPFFIVVKDESLNQRISDIIISLYGFIIQLPLAIGYGTNDWNLFVNEKYLDFKFLIYPALWSSKIMSGYGSILFECGLLGLLIIIIPVSYFLIKYKHINTNTLAIFMPIFMLSSVQVSNPLVGFIFGAIVGGMVINEEINKVKLEVLID